MTNLMLRIFRLDDASGLLVDGESRAAIRILREINEPTLDVEDIEGLLEDGEYRLVIRNLNVLKSELVKECTLDELDQLVELFDNQDEKDEEYDQDILSQINDLREKLLEI